MQLADASGSLLEALGPDNGIDPETARAVVDECRRTGASITDTLTTWGLLGQAKLRETMRR